MRVTKAQIDAAKATPVLDYLSQYEPNNIKRCSRDTYCLRDHDSLKITISNGMWHWFSRGIGGCNALDFLMKVRGVSFMNAVATLTGQESEHITIQPYIPEKAEKPTLRIPKLNDNINCVKEYLHERGISYEVVNYCLDLGLLAEDEKYHNCVFFGYDGNSPKFACMRSCFNDTKKDLPGSDKRYSFCIPPQECSAELHVFEGAIDAMSYATLYKNYKHSHLLSLSGVSSGGHGQDVPLALKNYLEKNPDIKNIYLHLDNDSVGRGATKQIMDLLKDKYTITDSPAPYGKDVNEYLTMKIKKERKEKER